MNKKYTHSQVRAEMLKLPEKEFWPVGSEAGNFLKEVVEKYKPQKLLEIGTSSGYSTTWLLEGLQDITAKIITIESNQSRYDIAQDFFAKLDLKNINLTHLRHHAPEVFKEIDLTNLDFIFCDAIKMQTLSLFEELQPFMTKNGVFIVDNVISHKNSMQNFYDYLDENNIRCQVIEKGAGLILIDNKQFYT
jgi:predicted O-methyltransferase YrrM